MKIKRISAIILLCVMMVSLLASCGERSEIPEGYQLVACEGDCFRLYVPTQGWMPNTVSGVTGAFFSMDENASVHVYVADDAGEMGIEEYWEKCNARIWCGCFWKTKASCHAAGDLLYYPWKNA